MHRHEATNNSPRRSTTTLTVSTLLELAGSILRLLLLWCVCVFFRKDRQYWLYAPQHEAFAFTWPILCTLAAPATAAPVPSWHILCTDLCNVALQQTTTFGCLRCRHCRQAKKYSARPLASPCIICGTINGNLGHFGSKVVRVRVIQTLLPCRIGNVRRLANTL